MNRLCLVIVRDQLEETSEREEWGGGGEGGRERGGEETKNLSLFISIRTITC